MLRLKGQPEFSELKEIGRRQGLMALAGLAAIVVILLVPVGGKFGNPWAAGAWNLFHLPGFFLLTRFLSTLLGWVPVRAGRPLAAAGLALAAGIVTELVQSLVGRSASVSDLVLDGFGIVLASIWPDPGKRGAVARIFASTLVVTGAVAFAFAPAWTQEQAERRARQLLPVIGDFTDPGAGLLWVPQGSARAETEAGTGSLRVRMGVGDYGGIQYRPRGQDWSAYRELLLVLSNPGPPLRIGVRIDDIDSAVARIWHSDEFFLATGVSEIPIPLWGGDFSGSKPVIDQTRIQRFVLFVDKSEIPVEFSVRSAVLR